MPSWSPPYPLPGNQAAGHESGGAALAAAQGLQVAR